MLEWVHNVIVTMLHTAEINKATLAATNDIDVFLTNTTWAIRSTYLTILKPLQAQQLWKGHAVQHPLQADWNNIGDHRQHQTDHNIAHEINHWVDYDYQLGGKVLMWKIWYPLQIKQIVWQWNMDNHVSSYE